MIHAYLHRRDSGYFFDGTDQGHISTRKIQRLLDKAAEWQDSKDEKRKSEAAKENHATLAEA